MSRSGRSFYAFRASNLALIVVLMVVLSIAGGDATAARIVQTFDSYQVSAQSSGISVSQRSDVVVASMGFDLNYGGGLSGNADAQAAFARAAAQWSTVLVDPVTIKLDLDYQSLRSGILGETSITMLVGLYTEIRDLVSSNPGEINNAREAALLPNLPTVEQYGVWLPEGNFGLDGNLTISQANYLALGGSRVVPERDGSITFSSNYSWDFDSSDGIAPGAFDFESVAVHEIGHALGFVSELDYIDYLLRESLTGDVSPTVLDFFRFWENDLASPEFDFTTSDRDITPGYQQAFYYGDGSILMSTGAYAGDGRQGSHWKDNLGLGIMDPTFASGEIAQISQNDLIAMDLIGWEIVPEPATIVLLGIGVLVLTRKKS